jgi:hypothetical protein
LVVNYIMLIINNIGTLILNVTEYPKLGTIKKCIRGLGFEYELFSNLSFDQSSE